jgi:hypothetical protein
MDMDLIWEGHFEFEFILELVVNQYKVKWDDVRNNCYKKYCHNFDSDAVRKKEKKLPNQNNRYCEWRQDTSR